MSKIVYAPPPKRLAATKTLRRSPEGMPRVVGAVAPSTPADELYRERAIAAHKKIWAQIVEAAKAEPKDKEIRPRKRLPRTSRAHPRFSA